MASLSRIMMSRACMPMLSKICCQSLKKIPVAVYSSTTKVVKQSEYVIGNVTDVDPKRVQDIIDEGARAYDEQNDPDSPYYLTWGFNDKDNFVDLWSKRMILFCGVSIVLVLGPIYYHYLPDVKNIKWTQAEAIRSLAERRANDLPLIDPDYIPRDKIILPDGDVETAY